MAPRKNYAPEQMDNAIKAVRNGEKIAVAAKSYGVPRITLYNKISGKTPINCTMGPLTVLSKDQEEILVRWLLALAEKHFPISKGCLQDSVQKIITDQKIPNPFTNNRPGKKWCKSFLKRHPVLVEKLPENLSKARDNVCEKDIRKWFQEIDGYLEENHLKEIVADPNRVFNADESAFFLSPKPGRVIAKKGDKHLYSSCGDEKENLTVLFTGNAAGQLAPPMIVYNYERIPSHIAASVPENWAIGKSESGWMCSSTFYEYVTNIFNTWLEEQKIQKPVLFFLDGHKSHLTLHLSNFCAQNGIEIIALYPNSTHILQPLDLAVFRPLKVFWKQAVNEWKMENLGQNITKLTFAPVLQKAVTKLKEDSIKNGFRAGGLCPFGPEYIDMTKLKHREEEESFISNPELTASLKYLENDIVKVFSVEKLIFFNELFYKNRNTVENCLPIEDTSLYVIWAKNKSQCGSFVPLIDSVIVNNRPSEPTLQTTTPEPVDNNSSVTGNFGSSPGPPQNQDMESQDAPKPEENCTDQEGSNRSQEDVQLQSAMSPNSINIYSVPVTEDVIVANPDSFQNSDTPIAPVSSLKHNSKSNSCSKSPTKEHPMTNHNISESISSPNIPEEVSSGNIAIPGTSNYRNDTITPQKKSMDAALGIIVPSPFKRSLFWPENNHSKKKTRIKREKIPSAVTSKAWREYHEKKEKEKKKLEQEKAERAKIRQEKKLLKEKTAEEKKRKKQKTGNDAQGESDLTRKRKKVFYDDSTSEDSDLEITFAESGDSYVEDVGEDFSEGEEIILEQSLEKKNKQKAITKRQQRQPKRQRTHSHGDTTDSDMDVPLTKINNYKSIMGPKIRSGCFVIVMYEGEYFPGKVENVNEDQYEVSTMTLSTGNSFRWPEKPDKIWYNEDQVIEEIDEPVCINKRGFYKIKEMDKYLPDLLYT